jgi:hypothetical protein
MPRNEPPMRKRLASSTMKSLPRTRTASSPTIAGGSHCSSVESSAALTITTASRIDWPITITRRRPGRSGGAGRLAARERSSEAARARSAEPAARINASDQATITSHRTTANQTITHRKVVPFGLACHRSSVEFPHDIGGCTGMRGVSICRVQRPNQGEVRGCMGATSWACKRISGRDPMRCPALQSIQQLESSRKEASWAGAIRHAKSTTPRLERSPRWAGATSTTPRLRDRKQRPQGGRNIMGWRN